MALETEKSAGTLPKITKSGSIHLEWKRCGRSNCRCATGKVFHGPYAVYHWRQNGIQKKRYVRLENLEELLDELKPRLDAARELRTISAELKEMNGAW